MIEKQLVILGVRGVPARHGGFETFAEQLSLFLTANGWRVTVYCQETGEGGVYETDWCGVKRIHIPVRSDGPLGTICFDFRSILHACKGGGLHLTLGYNTACFNVFQRLFSITNIINMDGIEWKRQKWGLVAKAWFWLNERFGCWLGNHLIADHPGIEDHLATRVSRKKITMIPYGAPKITSIGDCRLAEFDLKSNQYSIVIARPEPENSILEIVSAFSAATRNEKLVVLGTFDPENSKYHRAVVDAASDEVFFLGAIYDAELVGALRFNCRFYIHGHQVGGTNPSLVEALGAGCAVIAHDNQYNRWVASSAASYFSGLDGLIKFFDTSYWNVEQTRKQEIVARKEFAERFQWDDILAQYEELLLRIRK
jgi:glycosyltransferase involved in cell wall biosynthesis